MSKAATSHTVPRVAPARECVVEEPIQMTDPKRAGTSQVKVEIDEYESYDACRRFEVTLSQKLGHAKDWTEIGEMIGFLVDKAVKPIGKKGKAGLWIQELLKQNDLEDDGEYEDDPYHDDTHGVREVSRLLYTKAGTVRAALKQYQQELSSERFVFIDAYEKDPAYHVKGSGQQPMRLFLELLPQIFGTAGHKDAPPILYLEVEQGLIKAYQKNGFAVWLQGDPKEADSITIMGRMVNS